jgi:hypothetical protein
MSQNTPFLLRSCLSQVYCHRIEDWLTQFPYVFLMRTSSDGQGMSSHFCPTPEGLQQDLDSLSEVVAKLEKNLCPSLWQHHYLTCSPSPHHSLDRRF